MSALSCVVCLQLVSGGALNLLVVIALVSLASFAPALRQVCEHVTSIDRLGETGAPDMMAGNSATTISTETMGSMKDRSKSTAQPERSASSPTQMGTCTSLASWGTTRCCCNPLTTTYCPAAGRSP
jgi:hypothetical protein